MKDDDFFMDDVAPEPKRKREVPNLTLEAGLPANIDAEKTILGAILLDNDAYAETAEVIKPDDFSLDSHRRIYLRMVSLAEADCTIDIVTLSHELSKYKEVESIGGVAYLAALTEGLPRRPVIEDYIRIIKDKSMLRRLMGICSAAIARAADQSEDALGVLSATELQLLDVADSASHRNEVYGPVEMSTSAEERLITSPSDEPAIPTGIVALDELTGGGIRLGELWVIGAAPSRGKTTLARQIVKHCVYRDVACYVHSGEMSKESWWDVTACLLEGMPAWKVREPRLMNATERERLSRGLKTLKGMKLYISDAGGIYLDRLIWNARRQKQLHGTKVNVVDYGQIIRAPGRDRKEQLSAVADGLRRFAKDEDTAVVLLSQMARPEGRNINTKPSMFGLKESGTIEESAHVVVLPYRPIDSETFKFTGIDELIVGKSRWGAVGSIPVKLNGEYLRFDAR